MRALGAAPVTHFTLVFSAITVAARIAIQPTEGALLGHRHVGPHVGLSGELEVDHADPSVGTILGRTVWERRSGCGIGMRAGTPRVACCRYLRIERTVVFV